MWADGNVGKKKNLKEKNESASEIVCYGTYDLHEWCSSSGDGRVIVDVKAKFK